MPYTFFKEEVHRRNVKAIYSQGETITGKFSSPVNYPPPPTNDTNSASTGESKKVTDFTTILPAFVDPGLEAFLIEHKVEISAEPIQRGNSPLATLIFGFAPALLLIGFYVWMFRRAGQQGGGMGSLMGIGRSQARRYDQEKETKVSFDDVAGIDEAENELVEIVDFLKDPAKVHASWWDCSQGRAAGRRTGNRQDSACKSGRR